MCIIFVRVLENPQSIETHFFYEMIHFFKMLFGFAWVALQLAPTNSLLPRFDLANDRHLYLALPGLAWLLVRRKRAAA